MRVTQGLLPLARIGDARRSQDRQTGIENGGARVSLPGVWNMAPDEPADEGGLEADSVSPATAHLSETSVGDTNKANPPVNFIAMAYRWGDENGHWYFIYCGGDFQKGYAMARAENADRGGKYACAVYGFPAGGSDAELMVYFPSSMEEDDVPDAPQPSQGFFRAVGHFRARRGARRMPHADDFRSKPADLPAGRLPAVFERRSGTTAPGLSGVCGCG